MNAFTRENSAYLKFGAFILLCGVLFFHGFLILYDKWFWYGSYYSHGPLVVLAFIWLFLRRLKKYNPASENPAKKLYGFLVITVSIIIYLFAVWKNVDIFAPWAIYIFIVGNSILFLGRHFVIKNIGIYLYLLLAIPVPQIIIDRFTFELNLFASYTSEIFISFIYPSILRNGNILNVNGHHIAITHECSGLSNLVSMFSIVWLMALFQSKKIISVIDYLISIPAAIVSNILRIVIITILVVNGYGKIALDDLHSEIGMAVFIIIVILIAVFNELPEKNQGHDSKSLSIRLKDYLNRNEKLLNAYILFMLILVFAGFIIFDKHNITEPVNEILLKDKIPASIGGWKSQDEVLGENYYSVLGTNDLLMRAYREKGGNAKSDTVYLYIIRSNDTLSAFHRPEVCLRGEGYELLTQEELDLYINKKNMIPVKRLLFLDKKQGLLVYYWYYLNGKNLKDGIRYRLSFLLNINTGISGSFIRISKPVDLNEISKEEEKMKQFANEVIPEILKYL